MPELMNLMTADWTGFLAGLAVRSLLILGAAAVAAALARRASASIRHLVWTAAVGALLVMPILSIIVPKWAPKIPLPAALTDAGAPLNIDPANGTAMPAADLAPVAGGGIATTAPASTGPETRAAQATPSSRGVPKPDLLRAGAAPLFWGFGCAAVLLLMVMEIARLRRITRNAVPILGDPRSDLAERIGRGLGLSRRPRILEGEPSVMPMTWGFLTPVILLPAASRNWSVARLTSVLHHEMAHVRRGDYAVQLLAEFAAALYWFNPLVWYAAHRLKVERELACDDEVVTGGTASCDYADDLLELARTMRTYRMTSRAALSMARPSKLAQRLRAILDEKRARNRFSHRGVAAVAALALVLSAAIASVSPAMVAERAPAPPRAPRAVLAPAVPATPALPVPFPAPAIAPSRLMSPMPPLPSVAPAVPDMHFFAQAFSDEETRGRWRAERDGDQVWFELRFRSGSSSWTHSFSIPVKEFDSISARTHDGFEIRRDAGTFYCTGDFEVTKKGAGGSGEVRFEGNPDYIAKMKRLGYRVDRGELMPMASHDVSFAFIEAMAKSGYDDLTLDRLLEFRIHGVTPEFVQAMHREGLGDIPSSRLVEMRIHGVTPEFVAAMRRMGLNSYSADDFVQLRIHGVTPEFAEAVGRLGLKGLSIDDLLQMRIHGVTPEFVAELDGLGYRRVPVDQLVQMRIHGVTPEFIRDVQRDGYRDATVEELIEMKIMGRASRRRH